MLPLLRNIVADILKAGNDMKSMARETMTGDHAARLETRIAELKSYLQELEDLGCTYRDWDFKTGMVDFPCEIDGQPACLNWRSDEPSVRFYVRNPEQREPRLPIPLDASKTEP